MRAIASARRFALFLILDESDYYRRNYNQEHGAYNYRSDISRYPRKHKTQLLSHKCFFILQKP